jgi:hypothetical protein
MYTFHGRRFSRMIFRRFRCLCSRTELARRRQFVADFEHVTQYLLALTILSYCDLGWESESVAI